MRTASVILTYSAAITLATLTISWKWSSSQSTIAVAGCGVAQYFGLAGVPGCIASVAFSILTAFSANWTNGGGGDQSGNVKRQKGYSARKVRRQISDIVHEHGHVIASFADLGVSEYAFFNVSGGSQLAAFRPSEGRIAFGAALGSGSITKRDSANELWGVGADIKIDSNKGSDAELQSMAKDIGSGFGSHGGTMCSSVQDNGNTIYDIKWVIQDGSSDPGGSPCGN